MLEPARLVELTWETGAGGTKGAETVVTVELEPQGTGTHLRLTHAGFPDDESRRGHVRAWPLVLEQLEQRLTLGCPACASACGCRWAGRCPRWPISSRAARRPASTASASTTPRRAGPTRPSPRPR